MIMMMIDDNDAEHLHQIHFLNEKKCNKKMNARTKTVYNQLNTGWLTRLDPRLPLDQ